MIALVCLTLTGCADSHESVMDDMVSMMDSMITDLEGGMAPDKIKAKYDAKGKDLKARMDKLGKPSAEEQKRLAKKYEEKFKALQPRIVNAAMKGSSKQMPSFNFGF